MVDMLPPYLIDFLSLAASAFIFVMGATLVLISVVFAHDIIQKKNAVLRNYPVVGHLRGFFERLGEFFRQYFFAMDREEMPFNRAEREWIVTAQVADGRAAG